MLTNNHRKKEMNKAAEKSLPVDGLSWCANIINKHIGATHANVTSRTILAVLNPLDGARVIQAPRNPTIATTKHPTTGRIIDCSYKERKRPLCPQIAYARCPDRDGYKMTHFWNHRSHTNWAGSGSGQGWLLVPTARWWWCAWLRSASMIHEDQLCGLRVGAFVFHDLCTVGYYNEKITLLPNTAP